MRLDVQSVKRTDKPGAALRAVRRAKGMTLEDVSARTGFSVPTLSKIETGKINLSYDKLARLSDGLEVDIGLLFSQAQHIQPVAPVGGRRSVTRKGEGHTIASGAYTHTYPASDFLNKMFVPMVVDHHARTLEEFGELIRHPGEEYSYVLGGAVELHTDLFSPIRLEEGDSVYFDSTMGHAYLAAADGPCRVLSICGERTAAMAPWLNASSPLEDAATESKTLRVKRRGAA